ncbi:hypothetical protein A3J41_03080 [candidate division TM6 bacterium RIFCSPHIGHO2_12_FULL_38_8]|nr:MAG: hypothetical protein A3J41_03080 [candidate division TM6 bacterium RIFCSPHIGHO2_12_FULL_38_8]
MKSKVKFQIIFDENGKKSRVLMTVKQYNQLMSKLEDLDDVSLACQRLTKNEKTIPFDEVFKKLRGNDSKKLKNK